MACWKIIWPGLVPGSPFYAGGKEHPMVYRLAVEDIEADHWVAWVLDLPGCYRAANTSEQAIAQASLAIADFYDWVAAHDPRLPVPRGPFAVEIVEQFQSFPSPSDSTYRVNAFFEDDRRSISYFELVAVQRLLGWAHQDFQAAIDQASALELEAALSRPERTAIDGILRHVLQTEHWYFEQLGLETMAAGLPVDLQQRLVQEFDLSQARLVELRDDAHITENKGERWSARKVARRSLWHVRDHTQHIRNLLNGI